MILQAIRSAVFYALFLGQTVILAVVLGTYALFVPRHSSFGIGIGRYWGASNLFFLRWVVGIRTEVRGGENIPDGPCIIAAKHQSDWDIFAILPHIKRPAFIAKKQLMDIPFFGRAASSLDTITIDRRLGSNAIPAMMADARAALARGCQIIIFPEGTRRAPLADPDYRQGIMRMYEELNVPVVPVALNSGLVWGRNSLVLWPGTARATILPPIPPGLPKETFKTRLIDAIEGETDALMLGAFKAGVTRPVSPEWRRKFAVIEARLSGMPAQDTTTY